MLKRLSSKQEIPGSNPIWVVDQNFSFYSNMWYVVMVSKKLDFLPTCWILFPARFFANFWGLTYFLNDPYFLLWILDIGRGYFSDLSIETRRSQMLLMHGHTPTPARKANKSHIKITSKSQQKSHDICQRIGCLSSLAKQKKFDIKNVSRQWKHHYTELS